MTPPLAAPLSSPARELRLTLDRKLCVAGFRRVCLFQPVPFIATVFFRSKFFML